MSDLVFWLVTNAGVSALSAGIIATIAVFVLRNAVKTSIEEGVKFGFSKALEEHKAQLTREIETAKTSLKFSETRFSKQFEALVALRRYFRKLLPKKRFPEMEWDDAMEDLAGDLADNLDGLEEILFAHEAVLPTPVLQQLEHAMDKATDAQFEFDWDLKSEEAQARPEAIKLASEFYDHVKAAVEELQNAVDAQMPSRSV